MHSRGRGPGLAERDHGDGWVWVVVSTFIVFLVVGALITIIPVHVVDELGVSTEAIGVASLATGIGGAAGRLASGPLLRGFAWRRVALWALVTCIVSLVGTAVVADLVWFDVCRAVQGVATALFHTAITSGTLLEAGPERGATALAVTSAPLYVGTALGPGFGELLATRAGAEPWLLLAAMVAVALALMVVSAVRGPRAVPTGARSPDETPERAHGTAGPLRALHAIVYPAAIVPGLIWVLMASQWIALQTYLPLLSGHFGLERVGAVYATFAGCVVVIRGAGARWLNRVPNRRIVAVSCASALAGSLVLLLVRNAAGLYAGVVLLAVCAALGYGALLQLALALVRPQEHGAAVSTFSLMLDATSGTVVAVIGFYSAGGTQATSLVSLGLGCVALGTVLFAGWAAVRSRGLHAQARRPGILIDGPGDAIG
ncbi:hypothetical protein GCM10009785_18160 [Brooklawnia cerclae]